MSTSSPATYDPSGGTYAVYLTGLDVRRRTVSFDVIQFLVGADAVRAFHQSNPGASGGPPNDYWIVNASLRLYSSSVSPQVSVSLVQPTNHGLDFASPATWSDLPGHLRQEKPPDVADHRLSVEPYWLTLHEGIVRSICEQYTP